MGELEEQRCGLIATASSLGGLVGSCSGKACLLAGGGAVELLERMALSAEEAPRGADRDWT